MITANRRAGLACLAVVVGAILAGCAGAPATPPESHHGHVAPAASSDGMSDMPGMHHGGGPSLWSVQKAGGVVLVTDGDGNALYRSDADRPTPSSSTCTGTCVDEWEPVVLPPGQVPELLGVDRSAVGAARRVDGGDQLTLGGWPLYRHRGDATAQPDVRAFVARGWYPVSPSGGRVLG